VFFKIVFVREAARVEETKIRCFFKKGFSKKRTNI